MSANSELSYFMSRLLTHGSEYRRLTVVDDSDDGVPFQVFTHDVHTTCQKFFVVNVSGKVVNVKTCWTMVFRNMDVFCCTRMSKCDVTSEFVVVTKNE